MTKEQDSEMLFNRDEKLIDKIKELEEENKKLNELIEFNVQTSVNLTKINNKLEDRINKAFEYLENTDLGILELEGEENNENININNYVILLFSIYYS